MLVTRTVTSSVGMSQLFFNVWICLKNEGNIYPIAFPSNCKVLGTCCVYFRKNTHAYKFIQMKTVNTRSNLMSILISVFICMFKNSNSYTTGTKLQNDLVLFIILWDNSHVVLHPHRFNFACQLTLSTITSTWPHMMISWLCT